MSEAREDYQRTLVKRFTPGTILLVVNLAEILVGAAGIEPATPTV